MVCVTILYCNVSIRPPFNGWLALMICQCCPCLNNFAVATFLYIMLCRVVVVDTFILFIVLFHLVLGIRVCMQQMLSLNVTVNRFHNPVTSVTCLKSGRTC